MQNLHRNHSQIIRFLFVGLLNTIFGYGIFVILLYSGIHHAISLFFSTIIGIVFNFKTLGTLVFKSTNNKLIYRFFFVYFFSYFANLILINMFHMIGLNFYFSAALSIAPIALLSYLLNRRYVFN
ncbi:GtrA family protein [Candidatus Methylopumilus universalis]|nr:GtrA family protein [Candidatus Methylopumilus universalis]